jgi:uncharacterized protein with HEPN domain
LPERVKSKHADVPWQRVAAVGNVFRHEYDAVYPPLVWGIVTEHLPVLKQSVRAMLRGAGGRSRLSRPKGGKS